MAIGAPPTEGAGSSWALLDTTATILDPAANQRVSVRLGSIVACSGPACPAEAPGGVEHPSDDPTGLPSRSSRRRAAGRTGAKAGIPDGNRPGMESPDPHRYPRGRRVKAQEYTARATAMVAPRRRNAM